MPWCKTELEKRFASLVIYDGPLGQFKFCGLKNVAGSICAHVRRGRRFVMYEYNMSFDWNGLFFIFCFLFFVFCFLFFVFCFLFFVFCFLFFVFCFLFFVFCFLFFVFCFLFFVFCFLFFVLFLMGVSQTKIFLLSFDPSPFRSSCF